MIKEIFILRHAERIDFVNKKWGQKKENVSRISDPILSSKGNQQSDALSNFLIEIGAKIDEIYSSPFIRCLETILPYCIKKKKKINVEYGLSDFHGHIPKISSEYLPLKINELKKYKEFINENYESTYKFENVISFYEANGGFGKINNLRKRIRDCCNDMERDCVNKTVLVVSHAAISIALCEIFLRKKHRVIDGVSNIRMGVCSLSHFKWNNEEEKFVRKRNGDCSFLKDGEQFHWDFSHSISKDRSVNEKKCEYKEKRD